MEKKQPRNALQCIDQCIDSTNFFFKFQTCCYIHKSFAHFRRKFTGINVSSQFYTLLRQVFFKILMFMHMQMQHDAYILRNSTRMLQRVFLPQFCCKNVSFIKNVLAAKNLNLTHQPNLQGHRQDFCWRRGRHGRVFRDIFPLPIVRIRAGKQFYFDQLRLKMAFSALLKLENVNS